MIQLLHNFNRVVKNGIVSFWSFIDDNNILFLATKLTRSGICCVYLNIVCFFLLNIINEVYLDVLIYLLKLDKPVMQ